MGVAEDYDLGVAGGGILGLCVAWLAARKGARVLVVDESRPLQAATPASAGVIWPLEALPEHSPFWPWVHRGIELYPDFVRSFDGLDPAAIEFAAHGLLRLDAQPDTLRPGEQWAAAGDLAGMPRLQGAWAAHARRVSPALLQRALLDAVQDAGVTVVEGSLERLPETTQWVTSAGDFQCQRGVMATGAWSVPGFTLEPQLLPVRGQMLELELAEPWAGPMLQDADSYMVPMTPQRVMLGSTVELVGFDATPTAAGREQILREGHRILTTLGQARVVRHWAGLRPRLGEGSAPRVGRLAANPHLACAMGLYRLGVTTAPAIGESLASWAVEAAELPLVG